MKEYYVTNHGDCHPEARVKVSEETFKKFERLDGIIEKMYHLNPLVAKSLKDHYRNGVTEYTIDDAIKFVELMKLGFVFDMVGSTEKGQS